jgi:hypothetical protein
MGRDGDKFAFLFLAAQIASYLSLASLRHAASEAAMSAI